MRYIVRTGGGGFGGVRVATEDAAGALRAAHSLADQSSSAIEVVDEAGDPLSLAAFSRQMLGHSLSPDQLGLVGGTADVMISAGPSVAELFYARLFELAPETRSLFARDLASQKVKLVETIVSMIGQVTHPELFIPMVIGLARRHVSYGARPEHYPAVGDALLTTLADMLGPRFTPDVRDAWSTLYGDISAAMLAAAPRPERDDV